MDFDDSRWAELEVPGHWQSHPELTECHGPLLYRRWFSCEPLREEERAFVVFDGIFYQGDVWLDGDYLGDTEGYFFPHCFEVTDALRSGGDHILAVEVGCARPSDLRSKRNLTGVFQHWDCIDADWNPGGIWRPVRIERTGPVRIQSLKVLCREATPERAVLDIEAVLDSSEPTRVAVSSVLRREAAAGGPEAPVAAADEQDQELSSGLNVVRWRIGLELPDLWWPRSLGGQPLYRFTLEVARDRHDEDRPDEDRADVERPGRQASDRRSLVTGLRQIRIRDWIATVNGERLFLKGANYGPTRRDLAEATPADFERDVALAAGAGLDLLRVHAHISRPELYEAADRHGMLIWQDLPLQWGYGNVRRQAVAQARQAVNLLGHHPSIALWCGHNEPMALDTNPGQGPDPRRVARFAASQMLPTWNKTGLDRSIRRALEQADGSREVIAHSGILPHPAWGTDSHLYFGWYHGDERDLPAFMARLPAAARFVSEFGAQAVPETADFMNPDDWPDLDWDRLEAHHALQRRRLDSKVPAADHRDFESWRAATQDYQARLLRYHIEALRLLKYRPTGGFCLFMLSDCQPAVSCSILDHQRAEKKAYAAVTRACAPVIVTATRPDPQYRPGDRVRLHLHVVNDLRGPISDGEVEAVVTWPGGSRTWRFGGEVEADGCAMVGKIDFDLPREARAGDLAVGVELQWPDGKVANRYTSRVLAPD